MNRKYCSSCNNLIEKLVECPHCKEAVYCSEDCRKKCRKSHKSLCKVLTLVNKKIKVVHELEDWIREATISFKLHDVVCIRNDDFDEVEDRDDIIFYNKFKNYVANATASEELIRLFESLIIDIIIKTKGDIDDIWAQEMVPMEEEERLHDRIKGAERKIYYLLTEFVKVALDADDRKWLSLNENLFRLLRHVLYKLLELIEFTSHQSVTDKTCLKNRSDTRNFLTQVSMQVWCSVLLELKHAFEIDQFIDLFRKLAMVDCFDEDWFLVGTWNEILRQFSFKCGRCIKRVEIDDVIQERSLQVRGCGDSLDYEL